MIGNIPIISGGGLFYIINLRRVCHGSKFDKRTKGGSDKR